MKVLVVYDSMHGNTEKIARAMGGATGPDTGLERVGSSGARALEGVDLLIVGSPTHGGKPTPATQQFLAALGEASLKGVKVAAFDTRLPSRFVGMFGYAATRVAKDLESKGAKLAAPPEGFMVKATRGPLKDGEIGRAAKWAGALLG